ncbi:hypothetical protein [Pedobacter nanyangensis]|jgi:hypothetical protein|uniref:hypothetical protein n=1 Tax=Pedobacter nanyangensis TaxID=1562389 RepID=UPI000DE2C7D5|nr:hypothetical protein [Pedobacter nanyangensis]
MRLALGDSPDSNGKPARERSECGLVMDGGTTGSALLEFCASNNVKCLKYLMQQKGALEKAPW